ncbi:hypothetical protein [Martelella sp. HB161492]|uniref:hypothetical protein n=1 Tax=Martelella sp. HB161492 TaxID=2720726 RepID=UPI001592A890|nr:hypothetical protein [Martelella sp. HB161492]
MPISAIRIRRQRSNDMRSGVVFTWRRCPFRVCNYHFGTQEHSISRPVEAVPSSTAAAHAPKPTASEQSASAVFAQTIRRPASTELSKDQLASLDGLAARLSCSVPQERQRSFETAVFLAEPSAKAKIMRLAETVGKNLGSNDPGVRADSCLLLFKWHYICGTAIPFMGVPGVSEALVSVLDDRELGTLPLETLEALTEVAANRSRLMAVPRLPEILSDILHDAAPQHRQLAADCLEKLARDRDGKQQLAETPYVLTTLRDVLDENDAALASSVLDIISNLIGEWGRMANLSETPGLAKSIAAKLSLDLDDGLRSRAAYIMRELAECGGSGARLAREDGIVETLFECIKDNRSSNPDGQNALDNAIQALTLLVMNPACEQRMMALPEFPQTLADCINNGNVESIAHALDLISIVAGQPQNRPRLLEMDGIVTAVFDKLHDDNPNILSKAITLIRQLAESEEDTEKLVGMPGFLEGLRDNLLDHGNGNPKEDKNRCDAMILLLKLAIYRANQRPIMNVPGLAEALRDSLGDRNSDFSLTACQILGILSYDRDNCVALLQVPGMFNSLMRNLSKPEFEVGQSDNRPRPTNTLFDTIIVFRNLLKHSGSAEKILDGARNYAPRLRHALSRATRSGAEDVRPLAINTLARLDALSGPATTPD